MNAQLDLDSPIFSDEEVKGIREGIDGVKRIIPARFYHDEALYKYEVEHLLKKNWLCVGRWDRVEKPGDYFTIKMWGESIVIVRDKQNELHALINVCQHRWSQVVKDGSGNANMFMCPYHHWTYNLDGALRNVSIQDVPGFDKKKCSMPKLRIEGWQGFIFINFDLDANPLAPQLQGVNSHFEEFNVSSYREGHTLEYETTWNWKFSFETGYEGYHHAGLHFDRINHLEPASNTRALDFGETCGSYTMWAVDDAPREFLHPFGLPPGVKEEEYEYASVYVAIYPNLIMYLSNCQVTYIIVEHDGVTSNRASTRQSFAPWAIDSPKAEEVIAEHNGEMIAVQGEDTFGCEMLQKGVRSRTNSKGVLHPLEEQLNHFHIWYMDKLVNTK